MKRIKQKDFHQSQRGYFAGTLYNEMIKNDKIIVITADLGYGMFDSIRDDFPKRFLNTGASEQAALGIAIGMVYRGKIPMVYSITNFLLSRPHEWIRNYVNHESLPVKLIGGGRDKDYAHDGFSHFSTDAKGVLSNFPNIEQMWPKEKEDVLKLTKELINNDKPTFMSLRR